VRETAKEQRGIMDMSRPQHSAACGALDSFGTFGHGDAVDMK